MGGTALGQGVLGAALCSRQTGDMVALTVCSRSEARGAHSCLARLRLCGLGQGPPQLRPRALPHVNEDSEIHVRAQSGDEAPAQALGTKVRAPSGGKPILIGQVTCQPRPIAWR